MFLLEIFDQRLVMKDDNEWFLRFMLKGVDMDVTYSLSRIFPRKGKVFKFFWTFIRFHFSIFNFKNDILSDFLTILHANWKPTILGQFLWFYMLFEDFFFHYFKNFQIHILDNKLVVPWNPQKLFSNLQHFF